MKPARFFCAVLWLTLPALATAQTTLGRLFASPAERNAMEAQRGASGAPAAVAMPQPGMAIAPGDPNIPSPGMPASEAGGAAATVVAPPTQLVLSGTLRSSSGRSTVWLNDQPQHDGRNPYSRQGKSSVMVTLPSGKRVQLKAGQRYDLGAGQVKDVNEP